MGSARSSAELSKRYHHYYYDTDDHKISSSTSPDKMNIWVEPKPKSKATHDATTGKVDVVYYISKNGDLQHPHFMELFLSSVHGLYLRDVMNRLNTLRGDGMANTYSWSSKRSYKNGYVWQDLSENDLIHPTNGKDEYVLKGTEILPSSSSFRSCETALSRNLPETKDSSNDATAPATVRPRRNQSWSSFDNPQEYKVYKCESSRGFAGAAGIAGAGTATRARKERGEHESTIVELSREEISPPVSNSSSEVLVGMSGIIDVDRDYGTGDRTAKQLSGTMKVSKVLMQLISCGSASMKDLRSMRSRGV